MTRAISMRNLDIWALLASLFCVRCFWYICKSTDLSAKRKILHDVVLGVARLYCASHLPMGSCIFDIASYINYQALSIRMDNNAVWLSRRSI